MKILLITLLLLLVPHIEADASRQELRAGDVFSIDAHLFDTTAPIAITTPPGFDLLSATQGAGRALWRYRVRGDAPKGLARFRVAAGGLSAEVWVRVGPVVWPAALRGRVWLPVMRR